MKNILVGVTGGIAVYKTAYLVRLLIKTGYSVRVMMTDGACEFVTPLTFQALTGQAVSCQLLDETAELGMGHIELARWADMVVIAPATANTLAKLACGMADNLLTTVCLATTAPLVVAPAMNQKMWENAITQDNIVKLQGFGVTIISPESGEQACGDVGVGRMAKPCDIVSAISEFSKTGKSVMPKLIMPKQTDKPLLGKKIVITAGATMEAIDPVRYLSNHSTGKMGYAIAQVCVDLGGDVVIVCGKKVTLATPTGATRIDITSADDMLSVCLDECKTADIFIASAAVADFKMAHISPQKLKKTSDDDLVLRLTKNPDILATIANTYDIFTVGFAAETQDIENYAQDKLYKKNLDMIAVNDVSDTAIGFGSDDNAMTVFFAKKYQKDKQILSKAPKSIIASQLIHTVIELL